MKKNDNLCLSNVVTFKYSEQKGFSSVIVPVYKDYLGLNETLTSLRKQSLDLDKFEVIVANDGADKNIGELCRKFHAAEVKVVPQRGSYFARNKALEVSKGQFLLFTDADLRVPPDWIAKYKRILGSNVDYVGGNVLIDNLKLKNDVNYIDSLYGFPIKEAFENMSFFPTANLAVKRKVIEQIGGFDRRLLSGGDYEFGNRVKNFTSYKQTLINNVVIHPPRSYKSFVKKLKRIAHGLRILYLLYPKRFPNLKVTLFSEVRKILFIPPVDQMRIGRVQKIRIAVLLIWFQVLKSFYSIWFLTVIPDEKSKNNEYFFNTNEP